MKDGTDLIIVTHEVDARVELEYQFDTDDNPWLHHVMVVTAGRCLVITESGLIGLVPGGAIAGDEAVVIFGCCCRLYLVGTTKMQQGPSLASATSVT
jgi:hypothetical protein